MQAPLDCGLTQCAGVVFLREAEHLRMWLDTCRCWAYFSEESTALTHTLQGILSPQPAYSPVYYKGYS